MNKRLTQQDSWGWPELNVDVSRVFDGVHGPKRRRTDTVDEVA